MKCRDCENLIWSYDEGERIWQCRERYCPDLDIERDCPSFSIKEPDIFTTLSTLQAKNEKLRAELDQMAACIYYKAGGLCRHGGDDPAIVCVLGPCPHERSVQEVLTELEQLKQGLEGG